MTSDDGLTAFSSDSAVHKDSRDGRTNPEPELVASLIRGDEEAFAELIGQYHSVLLRVAMLHVSDIGAAEEVVQDTWIAVLQGIRKFEGRSSLKTWVFSILLNRARRRGERDNRTVPFSDLVSEEIESAERAVDPGRFRPPQAAEWPGGWSSAPRPWEIVPEEFALSGEVRRYLQEAIDRLPPAQRAVISLRDLEGWGAEEVCNAMGISESNQRVLLHRARSKVRGALETYVLEKAKEKRSS